MARTVWAIQEAVMSCQAASSGGSPSVPSAIATSPHAGPVGTAGAPISPARGSPSYSQSRMAATVSMAR